MTTTQWIATGAAAVSVIAIIAALIGVRHQLQVTVFLAYTERYSKVMKDFRVQARRPSSDYRLSSQPEKERARMLEVFREYFDLCSEELTLHKRHRIDRKTWKVWEEGMRQVARFPSFLEAWDELSNEYEYYGAFQHFINKRVIPHARQPAGQLWLNRLTRFVGCFPPRLAEAVHQQRRDNADDENPGQYQDGVPDRVGVAELRRRDEPDHQRGPG